MAAGETAVSCPFCGRKGHHLQPERCMHKYAAVVNKYEKNQVVLCKTRTLLFKLQSVYVKKSVLYEVIKFNLSLIELHMGIYNNTVRTKILFGHLSIVR